MKKHTLLGTALVLFMSGPISLPASAEPTSPATPQVANQAPTIPQSTAIVVAFPSEVIFDAKQRQDYPATVLLAQPILDNYGNAVAPANSPVSVRLKPTDKGAQIIVDSLIVGGQVVPIQASGVAIPGETVTKVSAKQQAQENSPVYSRLLGGLGGAFGGTGDQGIERAKQGGLLGAGIGALTGLTSSKKALVVRVPQGSAYVLTLQAPVALPATLQPVQNQNTATVAQDTTATPQSVSAAPQDTTATPQNVSATPQDTAATPEFNFNTLKEYSDGLEKILQAYQDGRVSKEDALNVIKAANTYATTKLSTQLLPPSGQRQRIHQMFNFAY